MRRLETVQELRALTDETPIVINGLPKTKGEYKNLFVGRTPLLEVWLSLGHSIEVED